MDASIDYLIDKFGGPDNRIVVADLCCSEEQVVHMLENFGSVIYFDHHQESVKIVALAEIYDRLEVIYHENLCSTALVFKYWVEKLDGKPSLALAHFAQVVEVYDNWRTDHALWGEAYGMNELFWKNNFFNFVKIFEHGMLELQEEEKLYVTEQKKMKLEMIETSPKTYTESGSCVILFETADALNDVTIEMEPNNYYMVYKNKPESPFSLSIRSNKSDNSINLGEAVEAVRNEFAFVTQGGGHEFAAGSSFQHGTKINEVLEYIEAIDKQVGIKNETV